MLHLLRQDLIYGLIDGVIIYYLVYRRMGYDLSSLAHLTIPKVLLTLSAVSIVLAIFAVNAENLLGLKHVFAKDTIEAVMSLLIFIVGFVISFATLVNFFQRKVMSD